MFTEKKIVCIIPARLQSSRFPKKILKYIAGKPILQWVWEAATKTTLFGDITFAIDSIETANLIDTFGGKYIMTSQNCKTGTDRLIEVVKSGEIDGDIFVNWQADEPFVDGEMIATLLQSRHKDNADMWTLKKRIIKAEDINSPNIAKVICDAHGYAMYFSRAPIPFYRDTTDEKIYYKHIGIFAYKKETLLKIATLQQLSLIHI